MTNLSNTQDFFANLESIMLNEYNLYHLQAGPVSLALQKMNTEQMTYLISQYTILPRELLQYMEWCRTKALEMGWHEIASELEENIAEELGKGNGDIAHHIMLSSGLDKALGTQLADVVPSSATKQMLESLQALFQHSPIYVLGTMYAVEKVSISELKLTQKIINILLKNMPTQLQKFYDMHLNVWEIEHEEDLRKSIAQYITPAERPVFEAGFRIVLDIFDLWWRGLLIECALKTSHQPHNSLLHIPSAAVAADSTQPHSLGLHGSCYADDSFLLAEKSALFEKTWQFVGHQSDAPNPGDYFTIELMGEQIVVIRTEENELRAFYNICTHRGAKLLDGKGHCQKSIICPYHSWAFDLKGHLIAIHRAKFFSNLDKSEAGLTPVNLASWRGLLFIKLENGGDDLITYLAGFADHLAKYQHPWEELQEIDRWSYNEPVNWKFFIENYSESYHLTTIHAQSLEIFDAKKIEAEPSGLHHIIRMRYAQQDAVRDHQVFSGVPEACSYQGIIFPNLMVNTAEDNVSFFRLIPISANETKFEVIIYQTPQQQIDFPYQQQAFRQEFDQVLEEDFTGVRRLQLAVRSKVYAVHQYADEIEAGITDFHTNLNKYLLYPNNTSKNLL